MSATKSLDDVRSLYFVPGADADGIEVGVASGADALCADLEDLVPIDQKPAARRNVRAAFHTSRTQLLLVRINPPSTPHYGDDIAALEGLELSGLLLPDAMPESVAQVAEFGAPIVAMVESPAGVRASYEIASSPATVRMAMGPGDLSRQLHIDARGEPDSLLYIRSTLVVDSAAAGLEGPFDIPGHGDDDQFERQTRYGRALGSRGKLCFSRSQSEIVNRVYSTP